MRYTLNVPYENKFGVDRKGVGDFESELTMNANQPHRSSSRCAVG